MKKNVFKLVAVALTMIATAAVSTASIFVFNNPVPEDLLKNKA
ncbi:cyclic lactone autoinducer peptide [Paenibacillus sp. IB182496]|uniref:Cyclic lactone autoinducer peptide n=1 Tax=Paenibacillus sabuli TaxID=2772509 RepID=A0A927BVF7_9BACL|nr:cyclic lactone autoinducer peptide [Paenibacillus sabuli]MBD2846244.1 cyclic lactone autoinducer peptide [Paenibacillus sabuli]